LELANKLRATTSKSKKAEKKSYNKKLNRTLSRTDVTKINICAGKKNDLYEKQRRSMFRRLSGSVWPHWWFVKLPGPTTSGKATKWPKTLAIIPGIALLPISLKLSTEF